MGGDKMESDEAKVNKEPQVLSEKLGEQEVISYASTEIGIIEPKSNLGFSKMSGFLLSDSSRLVQLHFYKQMAQKPQASFLGLEVCATAFNSNEMNTQIFNMGLGLNYYYFYTKNLAISAGISYKRLNQNLETRSYYKSYYDFGNTLQKKEISTQRLDYLQIPLSVMYRTDPKNMFELGVSFLILVQTAEKVQTIKTGEENTKTVSYEKGYYSAINPYDLQLSLGYTRFVSEKWCFQTKAYYGLWDVSKNAVFKSEKNERNQGLTLGLGYKL